MNGYSLLYEENSINPNIHSGNAHLNCICSWYGKFGTSSLNPNGTFSSSRNIDDVADKHDLSLLVCAIRLFGERQMGWVCKPLYC